MKKKLLKLFLSGLILLTSTSQIRAQEITQAQTVSAKVTAIEATGQESFMNELVDFQELKISYSDSLNQKQTVLVKNSAAGLDMTFNNYQRYQPGDKVKLVLIPSADGSITYALDGFVKRDGLLALLVLFVVIVVVVGRLWGVMSLLGLTVSFLVIFKLIIPLIIKGTDPVLAAILGSIIIIPATFYISHGFNKKTHVGVAATFIGLIITGLLSVYFVDKTHLTGFASEEAGFLQVERQGSIDIRGLLLAGIIIGTLGILDDVTIGQASTIEQLKKANPKMDLIDLFKNGMKVGQDHISSMINTLILVYSGSALPLLLLFFGSQKTFVDILEFELIAEEIVRMLVGSIGLVLSAPLATILAAYFFSSSKSKKDLLS